MRSSLLQSIIGPRVINIPIVWTWWDHLISTMGIREKVLIFQKISTEHDNRSDRKIAKVWNRLGKQFQIESEALGIDPAIAVGIYMAESAGEGFENGRLIIRFENHVFHKSWGKHNPEIFSRHFRFGNPRWKGHKFRTDPGGQWRSFHGDQDAEWETFGFAKSLDPGDAIKSISMGGPQIMGFNFAAIGYESPGAMLKAFEDSEDAHVKGLFDFIRSDRRMVEGIKSGRYQDFARVYNGPGQAHQYASIISGYISRYRKLVRGEN